MERKIIHLDMDAFYASVEMLDNPSLRGKPVVVGGGPPRGVVSAASYEAREYGIHSAMPIRTAMHRCPTAIFMPVRMKRYREVSKQIFTIFHSVTPLVEPISLDEAFLDVTGSTRLFGPAVEIAASIKKAVLEQIGLTVSAGIATSKLVAKIASDYQKPDGLTLVEAGEEISFLAPLPISSLWGVGKATREALALLGVDTIGDLHRLPVELLEKKFGKHGRSLYYSALGIDEREVTPWHEMKSVGHEETYDTDIFHLDELDKELLALSEKVASRLRRYGMAGRCITLKIRYGDFTQATRSRTISVPTNDSREIHRHIRMLLKKTEGGARPVRLLGVSLSHFHGDETRQLSLFPDRTDRGKRLKINRAVDEINRKFGATAILPARLLGE